MAVAIFRGKAEEGEGEDECERSGGDGGDM